MKTIRIVCTHSTLPLLFDANKMQKAKLDEGRGVIIVKCKGGVKFELNRETMCMHGEKGDGTPGEARFVTLKAKTILCTKVKHHVGVEKHFRQGKRYQIWMGRELGASAGYVFDEDGDRWNLYRDDVGFSAGAGIYSFEALYR